MDEGEVKEVNGVRGEGNEGSEGVTPALTLKSPLRFA